MLHLEGIPISPGYARGIAVADALDAVIRRLLARFERLDNEYLREREQDVRDAGRQVSRHLADSPPWTNQLLPPGSVVVAREVLPSETLALNCNLN